jgi:hypothetical protein
LANGSCLPSMLFSPNINEWPGNVICKMCSDSRRRLRVRGHLRKAQRPLVHKGTWASRGQVRGPRGAHCRMTRVQSPACQASGLPPFIAPFDVQAYPYRHNTTSLRGSVHEKRDGKSADFKAPFLSGSTHLQSFSRG